MLKKFLGALTAVIIGLSSLTADARFWTGSVNNQVGWAGYVLTGSTYTSISAKWRIPNWQWGPTSSNPFSGFGGGLEANTIWIGIGGFGDSQLIQAGSQIGTSLDGSFRGAETFSWYELFPASSVSANIPIKPGDEIFASMTCTANCSPAVTQTWLLVMKNLTTGVSFSSSQTFQSSMASAEWIVEPPVSGSQFPNVQFTPITFTDMTVNGVKTNPLAGTQVRKNQQTDNTFTTPSFPNGNSYTACWSYGEAMPNCPMPKNAPPNVRNPNP